MIRALFVFAALIMVAGCQPKTQNTKSSQKLLAFDSPIPYVFTELGDKDQAAMLDNNPISWSQLLSQDLALQELQERYNERVASFVHAWVDGMGETESAVVISGIAPKAEAAEYLKRDRVAMNENISMEFTGTESYDTIATLSGKTLSWDDFIAANIENAKLYERLFQQRMRRLNGIVVRRMILDASKASEETMEGYVRANIVKADITVSEDEIRQFAADKNISEKDLTEIMMKRLSDIIKQNKREKMVNDFVAKTLVKSPVGVAFKGAELRLQAPTMSEAIPQFGEKGPEMIYIGDWNCKDCPDSLQTFLEARQNWNQKVKTAFVYSFPVRDRKARMGAEAALCVESQKPDAFWTFLSKVVDVSEENLEERLNVAAQASGVDYDAFRDCFLKRQHQDKVDAHLNVAKQMGVVQPPLLVIQGQVLEPPFDLDQINATLKKYGVIEKAPGLWARIKAFFGF